MNLDELRIEIDQIDFAMQELFKKRMALSKAIGQYKKEHHLPVLDSKRELEILNKRRASFDDEALWPYYESFMKEIMRLSKEIQ
jgi:monofunctional chorismate mutase